MKGSKVEIYLQQPLLLILPGENEKIEQPVEMISGEVVDYGGEFVAVTGSMFSYNPMQGWLLCDHTRVQAIVVPTANIRVMLVLSA